MVKWNRRRLQQGLEDPLTRERRRILTVHQTILDRLRDEGAGAVLEDARQNAADALAVLDPNDVALASVLMALGAICETVGEVEEAEAAESQARGILLPLTDPDSRVKLATLLGNMAVREDGRLNLVAATGLREHALSLYREVLPEAHKQIGAAVQNLAATWEVRDDRGAADRLFAEHVALAVRQGGDPLEVAALPPFPAALPNLLDFAAKRFEQEGKLDAAEVFYRRAVTSAEVRGGNDAMFRAIANMNLATLIERRGRFDEARGIMVATLRELEDAGEEDPGRVRDVRIQLMNNLGLLQYRAGDLDSALALLEAALAARQAGPSDARGIAESLANLGLVRAAMGDLPGARDLMGAAYNAIKEYPGPQAIDIINNLGWIARATGEAAKARTLYEEALRQRRLLYGDRHPAVAESLNNLGVALLTAGEYVAARNMLQEGLDIRRVAYGPQHPEVVASHVNLASALMAAGELDDADTHLMTAWVTHLMVDPDMRAPATSLVLFSLAQHAMLTGNSAMAAEALEDALDHENLTTASILGLGSERARLLRLALVRGHVDSLISVALDHSRDPNVLATRVYRQVLRRKAMGLDFLALQRASMGACIEEEGSVITKELKGARGELQRAVHDGVDTGILAEYRARIERLEAALARRTPWQSGERNDSVINVLAAIPADAIVVDYVRCGVWDPSGPPESQWPRDRYAAFVLHPGGSSPRMVDLGDAAAIDESIRAYRTEILGPAGARNWDPVRSEGRTRTSAGERLRRLLLDPLNLLTGDTRRLVIVPDGMVHLVSFAALPLPGGRHLIDKYELSMLSSARDLLDLTRSSDSEAFGPPLVLADPDFDLADGDVETDPAPEATRVLPTSGLPDVSELRAVFTTLPATAAEGWAVGAVLGVQPVTGRAADRRCLLDAQRPVVLHLATHGFFLPTTIGVALAGPATVSGGGAAAGPLQDPLLRCGLVLAGANRWLRTREAHLRPGDGFVTGLDVLGLDLEGTQLVVLSACDTARGEIIDGEGVLGLSRAFVGAGAESLVMSLWKVPDAETADLMSVFYKRLGEGAEIPAALRDAQRAIRADHPHPVNWGAFISQGRVRPLTLTIPPQK